MKKNSLKLLSLLVFAFFIIQNSTNIYAQNSEGGLPKSFKLGKMHKLKKVPFIKMPYFDKNLLLKEDSIVNSSDIAAPFRFAKGFNVDYSLENSGTWDTLDTGDRIWRLKLCSQSAFSLIVYFSDYKIPVGGKLFIYGIDSTNIHGAFTSQNNSETNTFKVQPIPGDEITLEYFEPKGCFNQSKLRIGLLSHDYKGLLRMKDIVPDDGQFGKSSCQTNSDINCSAGSGWQADKGSVVRITFTIGIYEYVCTGALVNNTNQDGTPYILTASHCICSQEVANTMTTVFNYESPTCNGGDGSVVQSVSGATLMANSINTDFSLLRLNSLPTQYANPFFAGWNRLSISNPTLPVTCIHHPKGDVKKIANSSNQSSDVVVTNFTSNGGTGIGCNVNATRSVYGVKWANGLTQEGSSGGPLFNADHKIIGQLYGSSGDCGTTYSYYNYFGRLSDSWLGNNSQSTQLKYWLDQTGTGTGVNELNGTYLYFISGPEIICSSTATFSVKNLRSGDVINWINSSNTSYVSGQNTKNYTVQGGGSAWVQASITNSVGGYTVNLSKFYFTIGNPVVTSQIPLAYFSGSNYNNVCNQQSYTTSFLVDGASSVTWSRIAATPSNTSWYQSGNNLSFYFYNVNQTAVFRINTTNGCGSTSKDFGFKSIDCSGGGGGCNPVYALSPNPAVQSIIITPSIPAPCGVTTLQAENINGSISLYDNQGIRKKHINYKHINKTEIDVSDLKNGTYYLEINDGHSTNKQTIIVQH